MSYAIRFDRHGGPEVLEYREVSTPKPGAGEVLVRVHAAGLNFIDTYHRTGYYPLPGLPSGLGVEAAGEIEALGDGVKGWKVGQRVGYATARIGAYAQHQVVPAKELVGLPDSIDDVAAAGMLLKGMTARYLLRQTYPVSKDDVILVQAAAGGVGLILCQWAAYLGATVIGTVGSPEKAELARSNGCHHTILYREEDVAERVRKITHGEGVQVVYDSVGRSTFHASLSCLRQRGLMVTFGQSSGAVEAFDPVLLSRHGSLFLTRPTLFHYIAEPEELRENSEELFDVVSSGAVTIPVRQTMPLADAAEAHRALEGRRTTGSTVLIVD